MNAGAYMYRLAEELWPLDRSLSGRGVRETLRVLQRELPGLECKHFASGQQAFDWEVPNEWNIESGTLIDPLGRVVCDFRENNLSVVGYSIPVRGKFSLEQLQNHLYSLPDQPEAVPYVTSYYRENWGFCIAQEQRDRLIEGEYTVDIQSTLAPGVLDYGEIVLPGKSSREIFFSTYICHPSMANNELSGPVLAIALAQYLKNRDHKYTYRFLFIPETIGSIAYLSENLEDMRKNMLAGFVLTCVGDDRTFSYLPSRNGQTVADQLALEVFERSKRSYVTYTWRDRGSDERQYCAPGIDLPVCSVMRTKYGAFPEYHTSLDRLGSVVTETGLGGSFEYYSELIDVVESKRYPRVATLGEPQLGRRGLYPTTSIKGAYQDVIPMKNVISELDGKQSLEVVADKTELPLDRVMSICDLLVEKGLVNE